MDSIQEKIDQLIKKLDLKPHPEGGFFAESYRSPGEIKKDQLDPEFKGNRNYSTCIYFLLTSEMFSAFHRLKQDEIWHFYAGAPVRLHLIGPNGIYKQILVGSNFDKDQMPQLIIPGGCWFAAEVSEENQYSLVGCTVAPGFDFQDFEMGKQNELIKKFPEHSGIIKKLSRI